MNVAIELRMPQYAPFVIPISLKVSPAVIPISGHVHFSRTKQAKAQSLHPVSRPGDPIEPICGPRRIALHHHSSSSRYASSVPAAIRALRIASAFPRLERSSFTRSRRSGPAEKAPSSIEASKQMTCQKRCSHDVIVTSACAVYLRASAFSFVVHSHADSSWPVPRVWDCISSASPRPSSIHRSAVQSTRSQCITHGTSDIVCARGSSSSTR
mmetsp:Transcript_21955/g.70941  ORF Transcript_21955/g.70941 Transcript_21955/m.70941 type:complete len:212 (+) Transcript_21955:5832-6467(+)